jgi:cysteinyl-tRNA synthetase
MATARQSFQHRPRGDGVALRLYNVRTRRKEEFRPLDPSRVGVYVCGLTVYDHAHIGHARTAVSFEVARRWLERHYPGKVRFVQNVTDVDDKILARAKEQGKSPRDVAAFWDRECQAQMRRLGVRDPDEAPHVTTSIPGIVQFIEAIVANGFAYATPQGNVYFDVPRYDAHAATHLKDHEGHGCGYGSLSNRDYREMAAGTRKEVETDKRHPADFALWKCADADDHADANWDSPWGKGRPGWHIECSLMSTRALGDQIDVHGGGQDLIFPHHENEIAQSQAKTGKAPFVQTWMHAGFLNVEGEKMSKSLGNFITLKQALDELEQKHGVGRGAEVLRFYYVQTHYRSKIDFSRAGLEDAAKAVERLQRTRSNLAARAAAEGLGCADLDVPLAEAAVRLRSAVDASMDDDLHTPGALAALFDFQREANRLLDAQAPAMPLGPAAARAALEAFEACGRVLTLFGEPAESLAATDQTASPSLMAAAVAVGVAAPAATERAVLDSFLAARSAARAAKDWKRSDAIRDAAKAAGYVIEDTPVAPRLSDAAPAEPPPRRGRFRRKPRHRNESAFDRTFVPAAKWLLARGVHPNHFTFLQVPVFAFTILAAVQGWAWPFVLTTVFVMILDGGDGILARVGNLQSRTGAILDAVFDTLGIALLLWGTTKFHPDAEGWIMLLFLANVLLFLQNALLDEKVVSYVRGYMVAMVAFPQVVLPALVLASFNVLFLLVVRARRSFKALLKAGVLG